MIQEERISSLNRHSTPPDGEYVLYWMQASQRADWNHALEYAVERANALRRPLVVFFGLTWSYPEANGRHYRFMLEGLQETEERLKERGIGMVVRTGQPDEGVIDLAGAASLVVADAGYLRVQKAWRSRIADEVSCPAVQVESNVVVPVAVASGKEEWSAATFRPRISREIERFLVPLKPRRLKVLSPGTDFDSASPGSVDPAVDRSVEPSVGFRGGSAEAHRRLAVFLHERLDRYPEERNDPGNDVLSEMSPYLHFGQISPLEIALAVRATNSRGAPAYLEELIVRRELAVNFVQYNPLYDSFAALPDWAQATLAAHAGDAREYLYSRRDLEEGRTHDPFWNAAQLEMRAAGKMHGYMRMYWGKKILEWTETPEEAYARALYLNNRYELDGRDPSGYAGVAWCFGKHDRAWKERPIFGKVRYMSAAGLARKFSMDDYVARSRRLFRR
ncbi:deoxyribodipyrimidine photolyase [Methanoculleus sp. FWC-SCC1]|uniref:Deoxyribodipyrimidine photolyase n=1 Tax=Methanoculleus frigidifontis TaxID=2584085 RepID=A0ABT8MBM0_9EURY|nr:deoxyribodipyrimidine photo-lyase [Methanoculleus sp. FWC-SCC1]MDN7025326.1 deoxyribodipyrimidine photolyase [Methanoculleus sp. FWC-SCC1]